MKPDRLTQKSQEALQEAHGKAAAAGHPELTPEHHLLALVEQGDGVVPAVLAKAGTDVERLTGLVAKEVDSGVRDLLLDQHPRQRVGQGRCAAHRLTPGALSTTQSTEATSASMSAGSIAGNIPTRSWLRPSLR